jgi:hypothetical protein
MSSGLPSRFNACIARVTSRPSSVFVKFDISVSITPGATAFTRMPRENGGPVLNQRLKCSFGRGVSKDRRVFQAGLAHYRAGYGGRDNNDV